MLIFKGNILGIIIGLGSGRSGSVSLSKLINNQFDSVCFHEINPSCVKWSGTEGTVLNMIREFKDVINGGSRGNITIDFSVSNRDVPMTKIKTMENINHIGEVAFYYLNYVEDIIKIYPEVKFPCIKREKNDTVKSYLNKMKVKKSNSLLRRLFKKKRQRNHFIQHDGVKWDHDTIWDKCFPKLKAESLEEAIGLYWEHYYQKVEALAQKYGQVKVFDLDDLNTASGQEKTLKFCNYNNPKSLTVHENKIK